MAAPMIAAQVGTKAIENADTLAHVGFTGVSRIVQAIVIFLCVIIILIGIIVMSVGSFTTGLIWFAIGAVAMGGTIFWIRGSSGFFKPSDPAPAYQQPVYQAPVYTRRPYGGPRMPVDSMRSQAGPTRWGRGEEVSEEELGKMTEVGGDCNCGDDSEELHSSLNGIPAPGPETVFPTSTADNIIDKALSPRDVKGAGEAGELFDEAMLNDLTRDGVPRPRKPLTLHT